MTRRKWSFHLGSLHIALIAIAAVVVVPFVHAHDIQVGLLIVAGIATVLTSGFELDFGFGDTPPEEGS